MEMKDKDRKETNVDMIPVKIGSKEVFMPKTFTVKDLKTAAGVAKDRSLILHRGDKAINLKDKDEVDVEDGDYFKDAPLLKQGRP